jgi:hypothetical protein
MKDSETCRGKTRCKMEVPDRAHASQAWHTKNEAGVASALTAAKFVAEAPESRGLSAERAHSAHDAQYLTFICGPCSRQPALSAARTLYAPLFRPCALCTSLCLSLNGHRAAALHLSLLCPATLRVPSRSCSAAVVRSRLCVAQQRLALVRCRSCRRPSASAALPSAASRRRRCHGGGQRLGGRGGPAAHAEELRHGLPPAAVPPGRRGEDGGNAAHVCARGRHSRPHVRIAKAVCSMGVWFWIWQGREDQPMCACACSSSHAGQAHLAWCPAGGCPASPAG